MPKKLFDVQLRQEVAAGKTVEQIANMHGIVSYKALYERIRKMGLEIVPPTVWRNPNYPRPRRTTQNALDKLSNTERNKLQRRANRVKLLAASTKVRSKYLQILQDGIDDGLTFKQLSIKHNVSLSALRVYSKRFGLHAAVKANQDKLSRRMIDSGSLEKAEVILQNYHPEIAGIVRSSIVGLI